MKKVPKHVDDLIKSDALMHAVVDELEFDKKDLAYRELLVGMVRRQSRSQLIFCIWNNMSDEQLSHFRDTLAQTRLSSPGTSHEAVLIEFAGMYPALMDKVFVDLAKFYNDFIRRFNETANS